jgi:hypothetical protein
MTAIKDALEHVLRDVASTTDVFLRVEDGDWTNEQGPDVLIVTPNGGTTGIFLNLADTETDRIVAVAEQVQEVVIEELWARASNWPMCPAHRSSHPMQAALSAGEAWWACPADHAPVARIGELRL